MLYWNKRWFAFLCLVLAVAAIQSNLAAQTLAWTNANLRVMAANLNGDAQTIEPYAIRIFQGLKPDIAAIQEFNYLNNTAADIRSFVDTAFGTNFSCYRESGYAIPNGIISRYPILACGSWTDVEVSNRSFAWVRIDLPGTNDVYVVSVHLLTSGSAERAREAANLKSLIQSNFPANAWIVVAGDMNTTSRSEPAISTFSTFLTDTPVPTDAASGGDPDTNRNRDKPYDYVLTSSSLAARQTNTVFASRSFPNGLVFDSRVYTPLSDVSPVLLADSGNGQHMGVIKDFNIASATDSLPPSGIPYFVVSPKSQTVPTGAPVTFTVLAGGDEPLSYQWRSNGVQIAGATSTNYAIASVQLSHQAEYSVVVTNLKGGITSAPASLAIGQAGYSGILAGWDVSGVTGFGPSPMPPTTNSPLASVEGLTRGAGLTTTPTAATRAWGANDFGSASPSAAVTAGDYVTFSVSPLAGYTLSCQAISAFSYRRSSTGPASGLVQAQVGSGAFIDIATVSYTSTASSGAALPQIDLSNIAVLQDVGAGTNVTFRIVNYAGASGGNWYLYDVGNSIDPDFVLTGTVAALSIQPAAPPTLANISLTPAGGFRFTILGSAGSDYVLESSTGVGGPWLPIATNQSGATWSDSAERPSQFFRVRAVSR